jgi:hypothetical protein
MKGYLFVLGIAAVFVAKENSCSERLLLKDPEEHSSSRPQGILEECGVMILTEEKIVHAMFTAEQLAILLGVKHQHQQQQTRAERVNAKRQRLQYVDGVGDLFSDLRSDQIEARAAIEKWKSEHKKAKTARRLQSVAYELSEVAIGGD